MIYVRIERRDEHDPSAEPELLQEISIRETSREDDGAVRNFAVRVSHSARFQFRDRPAFRGFLDVARPQTNEIWRTGFLLGCRPQRLSPVEIVFAALQRLFDPAAGGRAGGRR